jgi:hypothetical protein
MLNIVSVILALILFALVAAIIVKKVLIGIGGTDSGVITLILIALCLAGMWCSAVVLLGVARIDQLMLELNSGEFIPAKDIELMKQEIVTTRPYIITYLIAGYISLVFDYAVCKFIEKRKRAELAKPKNHWDLSKIK